MNIFKRLKNKELSKVSGGESKLEKYLKKLSKDPKEILVNYGEGKELKLKNDVKVDDNNNVYVIKRERNPFDE